MRYTHTQISLFIGIEIAYVLSTVACKNDIGIKVLDKLSIWHILIGDPVATGSPKSILLSIVVLNIIYKNTCSKPPQLSNIDYNPSFVK